MILDFKEIPQANLGGGLQDTFELFTRDFLEEIGFEILQHPDRGADGKKDLIVGETLQGVIGKSNLKWVVSCKHFAHSGKSVSQDDEPDIYDRVKSHDCNGFIGFYSTLPASSLSVKLEGLKKDVQYQVFDRERIEKKLLDSPNGIKLAKRYFPSSIERFINENPKPAKVYSDKPELLCENCGKNLLEVKNGIFVMLAEHVPDKESWSGYTETDVKDMFFSCKGNCDNILRLRYEHHGLFDAGWDDIDDVLIPTGYLRNLITFINKISEDGLDKRILEKMKSLYINAFPYIARELTETEKERLVGLTQMWSLGFL